MRIEPQLSLPERPAHAAPAAAAWEEVRRWRKQTRDTLIAERMAMPRELRRQQGALARERLVENVDLRRFEIIGIYWPIRGEIDVRELAYMHLRRGGDVALPVVVARGAPVEFWRWRPGMRMQRGPWNIPIPGERELLQPDLLIVPLVGCDEGCYRLGYGGGYYDRTLAAAARRPFCAGLGYSQGHLLSIYPQPHDIPMDTIVTDGFALPQMASDAIRRMVSSASVSGAESDCAGKHR